MSTQLDLGLKVRMPSFNLTNEERNKIVSGFQAKAKQETFEENYAEITWEPGEREAAEYIYKEEGCMYSLPYPQMGSG